MSVHQAIVDQLKLMNPGAIFFPAEFRMLGTDDAIKMALSRLAKDKTISRLAHGIYAVPQEHPLLGPITPSLDQIAHAIAERDHIQIRPTGMSALNKLGLSQQIPTRHVYISSGQPRVYTMGQMKFILKAPVQKNLRSKARLVRS